MVSFNIEKFKAVIHYIVSKCGHQDNVGKTVLFKLLYFSDFDFYEIYEENITGEKYQRLPFGPAPLKDDFEQAISELESENKIEQEKVAFGDSGYQFRYSALKEPQIEKLSENELKVINDVISKCSMMSANAITDYSHEDLPWQATEMFDIIDYELVFYRTPKFSVRVYEEA